MSAFGAIYLFFNSASNDGIRYSTSKDGQHWTTISSVNARLGSNIKSTPHTSPSAAVHGEKLYLFWNKGNALQYATVSRSLNELTWDGPVDVAGPNLRLKPGTSSTAVDFDGKLYLFYNGSGQDGTFMTTFSSSAWSPILALKAARRYIPDFDRSSPATFTTNDGRRLSVMWNAIGTTAGDGLLYDSTLNGSKWTDFALSLSNNIPGLQLLSNTIPASARYQGRPFMFWIGASDASLYFSHGERMGILETDIDVDKGDFLTAQQTLLAGRDFTMVSKDPATIWHYQSLFGQNGQAIYAPDSKDYSSAFKLLLGSDPIKIPAIVAGITAVVVACLLRGYDITFHFQFIYGRPEGCRLRCWAPITNAQRSRL